MLNDSVMTSGKSISTPVGRLGRLPRKTSAHNYWHERDGRPRQQYQYIPSARHHPSSLPRNSSPQTLYTSPIGWIHGQYRFRGSRSVCIDFKQIFFSVLFFFLFFFSSDIWQRFNRKRDDIGFVFCGRFFVVVVVVRFNFSLGSTSSSFQSSF